MKVVLQRVGEAQVNVSEACVGRIDRGLLLLVGFGRDDHEAVLPSIVNKILHVRIFADEQGRFQYSILDLKTAGILAVPQFTLYGDTAKGRRPDFSRAMAPDAASRLFDSFLAELRKRAGHVIIQSGEFGANMAVSLINDGPVTILFES